MVLYLPGIVEAKLVGQFDLLERILNELVFAGLFLVPWQLVLVENAKLHRFPFVFSLEFRCLNGRIDRSTDATWLTSRRRCPSRASGDSLTAVDLR